MLGAEETKESEEPVEESLELRKLKILMENEEPDDPQGACLVLTFFKVFIINLIKSFMKVVTLFQLFLLCLILSKKKFSGKPLQDSALFIKINKKIPLETLETSTHYPCNKSFLINSDFHVKLAVSYTMRKHLSLPSPGIRCQRNLSI